MKLKPKELCPLHRRRDCCGREELPQHKPRYQSVNGVKRIPDEYNVRGYREIRTPGEMNRLTMRKMREQNNICGLCGGEFTDVREVVPDHKECRGSGGGKRDDHPDNIHAAHKLCNQEKGSMSMDQWRAYRKSKGLPCL